MRPAPGLVDAVSFENRSANVVGNRRGHAVVRCIVRLHAPRQALFNAAKPFFDRADDDQRIAKVDHALSYRKHVDVHDASSGQARTRVRTEQQQQPTSASNKKPDHCKHTNPPTHKLKRVTTFCSGGRAEGKPRLWIAGGGRQSSSIPEDRRGEHRARDNEFKFFRKDECQQ